MTRRLGCGFVLAVAMASGGLVSVQEHPETIGERLLADAGVKRALEAVRRNESAIIEEQMRLCEIEAPPFKEERRAAALKTVFEGLGLTNVRTDSVGNVLGERAGAAPQPHLLFTAHLDTVFPEGTKVQTTRVGPIIKGPGISDDCRGLAVLVGVIRALNEAGTRTPGTITFAGTVGEEGLGDLRGVKHLFTQELKGRVDRFVSVDGAGLGITHTAVGSRRYRFTFKGPGGHSYSAFGLANPIHALGRAAAKISDLQVPSQPRTTFNVGRIGGGTSVNSIPFEAWMEVDLRSADRAALTALDAAVRELDERIGLDRLRCLHVNDADAELGSNRDRHATLRAGRIGDGLAIFLAHPAFQGLPAILETAGPDGYAGELKLLRELHRDGRRRRPKRWR